MRNVFAAAMLVVFTSLNAIDGVCCPDGCTQEQGSLAQQHSPTAPDGICALCLGGIDSSIQQELSRGDIVTTRVALPPPPDHVDASCAPLEHPPRS